MKIKIIQAMTEDAVEKKVNEFVAQSAIRVTDLQFQASIFYFAVMVTYEDAPQSAGD